MSILLVNLGVTQLNCTGRKLVFYDLQYLSTWHVNESNTLSSFRLMCLCGDNDIILKGNPRTFLDCH